MDRCLGNPDELPLNGYVVDARDEQLVIVRHCGNVTDPQLEEYLKFMSSLENLGERGRKGALMYVMRPGASPLNASQRKRQGEWLAQKTDANSGMIGMGMVMPSAVGRAVVQAIFWIAPPNYPYLITGSEREALEWIEQRFVAEGVPRPGVRRAVSA